MKPAPAILVKESVHAGNRAFIIAPVPGRTPAPPLTGALDSYHERWFYGHTMYCITAAGSANDLPLLIHLTQASRHDSGTFVAAYAQLRQLYPELDFVGALLDSAHDAYDIYQLLNANGAEPFIDLNNRKGQKRTFFAFEVNDLGRPICLEGLEMVYNGVDEKRQRIKWHCPPAQRARPVSEKTRVFTFFLLLCRVHQTKR